MKRTRLVPLSALFTGALVLLGAAVWLLRQGKEQMFMPHAHCYLDNPELMLLHGGADLLIGLSYVAISGTLVFIVYRARREMPFHWMMLAFALFIVACGGTHFMELWTLRAEHPRYWLSGWVKLVTAAASVTTAVLLPVLIPHILAAVRAGRTSEKRRQQLENAYAELEELYRKATQPAPRVESQSRQPVDSGMHAPFDLATMARGVSDHARDLEKAKDEAEAANLAKDQFLAVLSHELRTPLTPALAAASGLEGSEPLTAEELREAIGIIRRNIELEARLVDDLLDLTRISKGKLEVHASTINLHETIQHAVDMCDSEAQTKGNNLKVTLAAEDHHIHGDGARLAQVFWNLLLNAIKFTPAGGNIEIRTSNPEKGRVKIEVVDTGIGIEPKMLASIFEPFQQGDAAHTRRYGGLGLGLSVAMGLVAAHSGTISAHSAGKGCGSQFVIELPTTVPPQPPRAQSGIQTPLPQRRLRILLAEDHADTRAAIERLLTRWGHEVRSAATVAEAASIALTYEADLLLSDIGLPDGTGIELLGKIRHDRDIPAIAMSGYGMESDLQMTKHAGFKEHLIKPVSADRLKETLLKLFHE